MKTIILGKNKWLSYEEWDTQAISEKSTKNQLTLIRSTDCSYSVGLTVSVRIKKSAGLKFPGHGNPMLLEEKE